MYSGKEAKKKTGRGKKYHVERGSEGEFTFVSLAVVALQKYEENRQDGHVYRDWLEIRGSTRNGEAKRMAIIGYQY